MGADRRSPPQLKNLVQGVEKTVRITTFPEGVQVAKQA
jgi:hypothetical protein